jgi:hypothetical protein
VIGLPMFGAAADRSGAVAVVACNRIAGNSIYLDRIAGVTLMVIDANIKILSAQQIIVNEVCNQNHEFSSNLITIQPAGVNHPSQPARLSE